MLMLVIFSLKKKGLRKLKHLPLRVFIIFVISNEGIGYYKDSEPAITELAQGSVLLLDTVISQQHASKLPYVSPNLKKLTSRSLRGEAGK